MRAITALTDAQKLDILLGFSKEYKLKETEDPAVYTMSCGTGYTLFASIKTSWFIEFDDGVQTTKHHIESAKIPYTNAKDARKLCKKYSDECKRVLAEKRGEPVPEQKEPEAEAVDLEEKMRILEALENGEIEKPDSRKEELPEKTLEDKIKEDEAKKEAEEKARMEREENEKRLEEYEKFEHERAEAIPKKTEAQSVKPSEKKDVMYSQPEDKLETAPVPKKGEVRLLDILCDLVDDDLIQIFGKTGTCKTSIAIQAGLEARKAGKSVYYLDTEKNISKKKKAEMLQAGVTYHPYTPSNINKIFESVRDIEALHDHIKKIPKVDLLIVDSLGLPCLSVYCAGNQREQGLTLQKMMLISNTLKSYANRNNSLVIVINQPESDMNKDPNTERRSFGDKVEFFYKELLKTCFVSKSPDKTTVVAKTYRSRDYGQGTKLFTVEITDNGVKVVQ